jgi:uncharacterized protein YoxC
VVVSSDWAAVIGISVAVMAVVQVATLIAVAIGLQRMQSGVKKLEAQVDAAVSEFRPQVQAMLDQARSTSANAQELMHDLRDRFDRMDEAAKSMGARIHRVADTVQWAATSLPVPMKVSGPAAMAAWAGVRVVRSLVEKSRARRLRQRHDAMLREAGGHLGIG